MSRRGVVLRQVADATGKGVSTVNAWTTGKNWPELGAAVTLCRFLDVSMDWLFCGQAVISGQTESTASTGAAAEVRDSLEKEIWDYVEGLLSAADNQPPRLGYLLESLRAKIPIPEHWADDVHDRVLRRVITRSKDRNEARNQSSPGKAQGAAG